MQNCTVSLIECPISTPPSVTLRDPKTDGIVFEIEAEREAESETLSRMPASSKAAVRSTETHNQKRYRKAGDWRKALVPGLMHGLVTHVCSSNSAPHDPCPSAAVITERFLNETL